MITKSSKQLKKSQELNPQIQVQKTETQLPPSEQLLIKLKQSLSQRNIAYQTLQVQPSFTSISFQISHNKNATRPIFNGIQHKYLDVPSMDSFQNTPIKINSPILKPLNPGPKRSILLNELAVNNLQDKSVLESVNQAQSCKVAQPKKSVLQFQIAQPIYHKGNQIVDSIDLALNQNFNLDGNANGNINANHNQSILPQHTMSQQIKNSKMFNKPMGKMQLQSLPNMIKNTNNQDLRESQVYKRIRNFSSIKIDRQFIFEGLPYVQYDSFILKDIQMQRVVIKDLLVILTDKCLSFKNQLMDLANLQKISQKLTYYQKIEINKLFEEICVCLDQISMKITYTIRDYMDTLGIKSNPIIKYKQADEMNVRSQGRSQNSSQHEEEEVINNNNNNSIISNKQLPQVPEQQQSHQEQQIIVQPQEQSKRESSTMKLLHQLSLKIPSKYQKIQLNDIKEEQLVLFDNIFLYNEMTDYFRDCSDIYRIIIRQPGQAQMDDLQCRQVIQMITKARFNISQLMEQFKISEKSMHLAESLISFQEKQYQNKVRSQIKNQSPKKTEKNGERKLTGQSRYLELMQKKFNTLKNKNKVEVNVNLKDNNENGSSPFLKSRHKKQYEICNNLERLKNEKFTNPLMFQEIAAALKVVHTSQNLQLSKILFNFTDQQF